MTDTSSSPAARPGRPRRYEAGEERQRIFDAAFDVMRRVGYENTTIGDLLTEAGMSTRSFYRHFASKDDLLAAMFRQDAEQFAAAVEGRVAGAPDARRAVELWIDEILAFGLGRPRAQRAAVLGSPAAMSSLPRAEIRHALDVIGGPLAAALARGAADGSFPGVDPGDPTHDAVLVSSVAWESSSRLADARSPAERAAVRERALSFVHRALGTRDGGVSSMQT